MYLHRRLDDHLEIRLWQNHNFELFPAAVLPATTMIVTTHCSTQFVKINKRTRNNMLFVSLIAEWPWMNDDFTKGEENDNMHIGSTRNVNKKWGKHFIVPVCEWFS